MAVRSLRADRRSVRAEDRKHKEGTVMAEIVKEGKRLRFRQATEEDLDYIMEAENRKGNVEYIIPDTRELHRRNLKSEDECHLIIEERQTGRTVGFVMIAGLASPHHEIEWRRIVVDEKGKGFGQEVLYLLESWSFDDLHFHRGWLDCKDYNARAMHVYEKAGLQREGLFRETIYNNGVYENLVVLGILDREYAARRENGLYAAEKK